MKGDVAIGDVPFWQFFDHGDVVQVVEDYTK